jgi:hypothetical protein
MVLQNKLYIELSDKKWGLKSGPHNLLHQMKTKRLYGKKEFQLTHVLIQVYQKQPPHS